MRVRHSSTALAAVAIYSADVTATPAQQGPPCVTRAEMSSSTMRTQNEAAIVHSWIRRSGLTSAQIRHRLTELGYDSSTLDPYLTGACLVPSPSDTVRLALQALGLTESSTSVAQGAAFEFGASVTIAGDVPEPLTVAYRQGMTLGDLITEAGRLRQTADLTVEVYRVMRSVDGERLPIPEIHSIRVDSAYLVNRDAKRLYAKRIAGFTYLVDRAAAFKLMPYDRVVVNMLHRRLLPSARPLKQCSFPCVHASQAV